MTGWLWTLPIVGAIVGWTTNWLAVRMLFRPRRPVRLFGITFLGLLPRRRKEIAASVASTVERELVRPEDIQAILANPELMMLAEIEIDRRVREFLRRKVDELPAIALIVMPVDLEDRLRKSIVKHVMRALPEISGQVGSELTARFDVRKLVEDRMNRFEAERLERIVLELARRELRAIELLGAVIGAAVGGVQWAMLALLG